MNTTLRRLVSSATFILMLLSIGLPSVAYANVFYWTGQAGDRWENANNWTLTPYATGGAGIPGTSDVAVLRRSGSLVRIRSAVSVEGLVMSTTYSGSLRVESGTLTIGSSGALIGSGRLIGGTGAIAVNGNYTQTGGIVTGIMGTMTVTGDMKIENIGGGSPNTQFTSTGTVTMAGTADQRLTIGSGVNKLLTNLTINNSGGGSDDDVIINMSGGLRLSGDLVITLGHLNLTSASQTLILDDDLTTADAAQATMAGTDMTIAGDITIGAASTFTQSSGTATLDGSSQTINGTFSFYNLTKLVTNANTLSFGASKTVSIDGTLYLQGSSNGKLSLRSTTSGTQWKINPANATTLAYLDVKDSNNTNSTEITCTTFCIDSTNNTNWDFAGGDAETQPAATTTESSGGGGGGSRGSGGAHKAAPTAKGAPVPAASKASTPQSLKGMTMKQRRDARVALRKARAAETLSRAAARRAARKAR